MSINELMKSFGDIGKINNEIDILTQDEKDYIFNIMIRITKTHIKEWDEELKILYNINEFVQNQTV